MNVTSDYWDFLPEDPEFFVHCDEDFSLPMAMV